MSACEREPGSYILSKTRPDEGISAAVNIAIDPLSIASQPMPLAHVWFSLKQCLGNIFGSICHEECYGFTGPLTLQQFLSLDSEVVFSVVRFSFACCATTELVDESLAQLSFVFI